VAAEPAIEETPSAASPLERRIEELRPYTGFNVTKDVQFLLGMGADIGPITAGSRVRLVPQVSVGIGEGPESFSVTSDFEYRFSPVSAGSRIELQPMVSAGPGLILRNKMELQLGMFLGTGVKIFDTYGMEKVNLFGGIQGVDFFDDTRIIVGLRRLR
jgi:hypothetical protein